MQLCMIFKKRKNKSLVVVMVQPTTVVALEAIQTQLIIQTNIKLKYKKKLWLEANSNINVESQRSTSNFRLAVTKMKC